MWDDTYGAEIIPILCVFEQNLVNPAFFKSCKQLFAHTFHLSKASQSHRIVIFLPTLPSQLAHNQDTPPPSLFHPMQCGIIN